MARKIGATYGREERGEGLIGSIGTDPGRVKGEFHPSVSPLGGNYRVIRRGRIRAFSARMIDWMALAASSGRASGFITT
jgi:hypothetical protein